MSFPIDSLSRRQWVRGCAAASAVLAATVLSTASHASTAWPTQTITLIVPYAAGGNVDVVARWIAPELSKRLGQPVVIDNVTGAGGVIGTEKAVRAKPDGHTLLLSVESTVVIAKMVTPSVVRYDGLADLAPITLLGVQPLALMGKPALAAQSAGDLYREMKANPGKFSYATTGVGTSLHLGGEMLKQQGEVDMVHVPYRVGSQIITDLAGNQLDLGVLPLSMGMQQARAGKLRVFGVLDHKASPAMPEVPPLGSSEPAWRNTLVTVWQGLFAPKGTPDAVIQKIHAAAKEALAEPSVAKNFADSGVTPSGLGPDAFAKFLRTEQAKFQAIVTKGQIKAE
jgi:tripartite-type tricarboxylate transporter receptor subunit TctC